MHQQLLHRPRPDGPDASITTFRALRMSAADYVLFKIVVNCILPITSRALAVIRPPHMFLVYALLQRLDIDITAQIFASIIHHTSPVHGKIHMPFGHILTGWLESMGIDVSRGKVEKMTKKYSRLGLRAFSKSKITTHYGGVRWVDGRAPGMLPADAAAGAMDVDEDPDADAPEAEEEAEDPDFVPEPDYQAQLAALDGRFTEFGIRMDTGFARMDTGLTRLDTGFTEVRSQISTMQGQVTGLYDMMQAWMLGHPAPQPSSSAPPEVVPAAVDPDVPSPEVLLDPATGEVSLQFVVHDD